MFDNALKLDHRVALYVPGTVAVNRAADTSEYIKIVAASFSEWFGGCSAQTVRGYWTSETTGELIEEQTTVIYANCTEEAQADHIRDVERLADRIKEELSQEAVSVEIDNTLYIV